VQQEPNIPAKSELATPLADKAPEVAYSESLSYTLSNDSLVDSDQQQAPLDVVPRSHSPFSSSSENRLRSHRKAVYYEEAPFIDDDGEDESDTAAQEFGTNESLGAPKSNTGNSSPGSQASSIAPPEAYGLPPGWQVAYGKCTTVGILMCSPIVHFSNPLLSRRKWDDILFQ
jgi:hypothetical protein